LDLREIALSGRQFTWANRRETLTFEKSDQILGSVEWEQKCPLVSVRAFTHPGSNRTPLLIDLGHCAHIGNSACFCFELSWLHQEGFFEIVAAKWGNVPKSDFLIQNW
jgi:hypothetical protein